jgi:ribosome assembly protein 4
LNLLYRLQVAQQRYDVVVGGQPERLVSGSDDHTMFLWTPSTSKTHVARMTGHVQLINQVRGRAKFNAVL